ncbi:hypothetical protein Adt_26830 [Abeliophyllum distichum]|uniref:Uncharacterized protein n=1 Tax=Abeliophyllum distichum TaxID=126358 RepID=A0ABD1RS07_9LAMI
MGRERNQQRRWVAHGEEMRRWVAQMGRLAVAKRRMGCRWVGFANGEWVGFANGEWVAQNGADGLGSRTEKETDGVAMEKETDGVATEKKYHAVDSPAWRESGVI